MNVHFIAIGGSAMHNLAIALKKKGYEVTGSDDQIFEPSRSRLDQAEILPKEEGWNPQRIHKNLDAIILGMHARKDNPELKKAMKLGLKIYSYPEYLYEQTKNKTRIVIGGSHGKTTITSMIMHVLKFHGIPFDYMVGSQLKGFETMVNLESDNKLAVFEGDEYLSSPLDPRPKFHHYKPNIAVISGIAWDHINVFPSFKEYMQQFNRFIDTIDNNGTLIYYNQDQTIQKILKNKNKQINYKPYSAHPSIIKNQKTYLRTKEKEIPVEFFGKHNMENLEASRLVCSEADIHDDKFYEAIETFEGAAKRLECLEKNKMFSLYKDFAHAPSKVQATVKALKEQYHKNKLIAILELHTFSSLNKDFLSEYRGSMRTADEAIVYYNPDVIAHKQLPPLNVELVKKAFQQRNLTVFTNKKDIMNYFDQINVNNITIVFMSSGTYAGVDLPKLSEKLKQKISN